MVRSGLPSDATPRTAKGKSRLSAKALIVGAMLAAISARAQLRESAARLVARTMGNPEFRPRSFRGGTWLRNGDAYLDIEPSAAGIGSDIVKYGTARGAREIFVGASRLIPSGEKTPLGVEHYSISPDGHRLLVFTNSKTVWRQNTRGDY